VQARIKKRISLMFKWMIGALAGITLAGIAQPAQAQATLDAVRARGALNCGVNTNAPGFTTIDSRGDYQGMVADLCRGLAAAIFSDATKVRWVPLTFATRFTALTAGEVDVLMLTSTHTVLRDSTLGLRFTANYFYDGHGFMAARATNATNVAGLAGASTTSSPVDTMLMRGRRITPTRSRPAEAQRDSRQGSSRSPEARSRSPARKSRPACRTLSPTTAEGTSTPSPSRRASSWMTTASAPSGRAAPVKIRIA
jgi:hypothetical protein